MTQKQAKGSTELDSVLRKITDQYGSGAIMKLDAGAVERCDAIPTGSPSLDEAIGVGGIPRGAITEVFGPESAGKTTLALQTAVNAQRAGLRVAFIDAENALDLSYAEDLGLQRDSAWIAQPPSGEEGLQIVSLLARSGEFGLVIVDSVAALVPQREIEGEIGDSHVGLQARMMAQATRIMQKPIKETNTAILFINQIRMKIGVMFGNPETTPGGRALGFAASLRLDIRRIGAVKHGDQVIGNRTKVKVVKNKVAAPMKTAEFDIIFGKGISTEGDLIDIGIRKGLLKRSGNWIEMTPGRDGSGSEKIGNGREKARVKLQEDGELKRLLEERLRSPQAA